MSERIEKILARELNEPRSRVKTLLQKGQVTVDGVVRTLSSAGHLGRYAH